MRSKALYLLELTVSLSVAHLYCVKTMQAIITKSYKGVYSQEL